MTVIESAIQKLRNAPLGDETIRPSLTIGEIETLICAAELMVAMMRAMRIGAEAAIPQLSEEEIADLKAKWERMHR